ncbi:MAG: phosphoribosylformylglycinamidine cyclo-ligase [Bacteroidetes bacterium]|jgi:phosphoribosylformylglycinamidine cyclo-ligase|nr:phosphoribosylformylglycinamidine cyclo-ligase [Bacteroidota bacterium]
MKGKPLPTTYAKAGVNIEEGDRFVRQIKQSVRSTYTAGVIGDIGAFGGFFSARFKGYKAPVLVSSVDGVGTKVMIANMMRKYDTVGQDLVNHCVNDILVCGARPLYFLDYFATGRLNVENAAAIISGFAKACRENGCALIGGETAEMPGIYQEEDFDLAGTIVGVVDKKNIITGKRVRKGDILVGLPSSGLHTNGYSLARAVLLKTYSVDSHVDELGSALGDALLAVHRSYQPVVRPLLGRVDVHALSHITGGGIVGNTMRVMPKGRALKIDWEAWARPAIFNLIQHLGEVPEDDMRRTFNLGVGLIIVVPKSEADTVVSFSARKGLRGFVMGEVE